MVYFAGSYALMQKGTIKIPTRSLENISLKKANLDVSQIKLLPRFKRDSTEDQEKSWGS